MSYSQPPVATPVPFTTEQPEMQNIIVPVAIIPDTSPDIKLFIDTRHYGKTIEMFTKLEGICFILYLLMSGNISYLFPIICSIIGFYGATKYNKHYINIYIFYNLFFLLAYTSTLLYNITKYDDNSINELQVTFICINALILFWIIRICYKFNTCLYELNKNNMLHMIRFQTYDNVNNNWNCKYLF